MKKIPEDLLSPADREKIMNKAKQYIVALISNQAYIDPYTSIIAGCIFLMKKEGELQNATLNIN